MQIDRLYLPVPELEPLQAEAALQSFRFVDRLISDWSSGLNTFNQEGETLLGVYEGKRLIAVGGLNIDPYASAPDTGRIRHLYVVGAWRRRGVGRFLVESLLSSAEGAFSAVRLRTDSAEAATFYESCGFDRVDDESASHRKILVPQA